MAKKYRYGPLAPCTQCVTFRRVSTKDQAQEQKASLDAQKTATDSYCERLKLPVINRFKAVESSTNGKRKHFEEMLDFVRKQKRKTAIVVHCIDRFQRRFNECVEVEELLLDDKIELHFCKEGLILTKNSPSSDIMRWDMGILSGKMYVANLRDNVNRGMNYNWSKGLLQTKAPIGFLNIETEDNKPDVVIDPERAPIIKKMFELYATGHYSITELHKIAVELGLCSVFSKSKKPIGRNTVFSILKNSFYYGEMKIRGQLMPHCYQTLITKDLFDKVQYLLSNKKNHTKPQVDYASIPFAFRGLIKCAHCGCTLSSENHTKKSGRIYRYLRCSKIRGNCSQKLVSEEKLLNQLDNEVFSKIKINENMLDLIKKNVQKQIMDESKANAAMKRLVTNELAKLDEKEQRIKEIFFDGDITRLEWNEEKEKIARKRQELEETAAKYEDITEDIKNTVNDVLDIATSISKIMEEANPLKQNELLSLLLEECQLDGDRIIYRLKKPFDRLVNGYNPANIIDFKPGNIQELTALADDIAEYQENMRMLDEL